VRSRPLLSAAIIVRDEADFLRECLTSIRDVCDEIVVVDTGSVDDSREVARSFDAVLGEFPWNDSFADARNVSLEMATGEWILYIDADEQLVDLDIAAARAELEARTDAIALRTLFYSRPHYSPYREFRVWRHRDDIRFFGRIHEAVVPDILRVSHEQSLVIDISASLSICHYGYEGDQTHKHLRNLPLLERRVVEFPNRCYLWHHLGSVRIALGDEVGALDAWMTGLALIRQRGIDDMSDSLLYSSVAKYHLERGDDISDLLDEMRTVVPWFLMVDWYEGIALQRLGRHEEAIDRYQYLIAKGPNVESTYIAYDNRIFTDLAWSAIGVSLYELGRFDGSLQAYRTAAAHQPENLEYRTKVIALQAITGL
jgi:glycosyltransferase involved in cell wall biosynthesis